MSDPAPPGPVLVVGCGLLGTSIGLACRRAGVEVLLSDLHETHVRTASGLGAGTPHRPGEDASPALVVVAVPPDAVAEQVVAALRGTPGVVTDVSSVKERPLAAIAEQVTPAELARYVGSHPMAGSERSGPLAAAASLFDGRPWAVVPHEDAGPGAVAAVRALAAACGAVTPELSPAEHDRAVARTSHLPHLVSALVAGSLRDAPAEHVLLSGQGVRDVTRVAGSDPALWVQILAGNRVAVGELLDGMASEVERLRRALAEDHREELHTVLDDGVAGTRVLAGKHGRPAPATETVEVALSDEPGELARLFAHAGEGGVNVEDVAIDHDPGRPMGRVRLTVAVPLGAALHDALHARGWDVQR